MKKLYVIPTVDFVTDDSEVSIGPMYLVEADSHWDSLNKLKAHLLKEEPEAMIFLPGEETDEEGKILGKPVPVSLLLSIANGEKVMKLKEV